MKTLKNIFNLSFIATLIAVPFSSHAQLCLGEDTTLCVGKTVSIQDCNIGGVSGGDSSIVLTNPTNVSLSDDSYSGIVNIGFTFSFYGNNYTQCVIGSNGLVTFDVSKANGYCSWSLTGGQTLPTTSGLSEARNAAMICYQDINPGQGGQIQYQTIGTAPNRMFVVLYNNIPMFSSGECQYMALILRETSNKIEYHIGNKSISNSNWNSSLAIQAVENQPGNTATVTPGRNNTVWTASNDARLYSPVAPNNTSAYQVSPIPYKSIISTGGNFGWKNTLGQTFPYNNGILNVTSQMTATPGTVGYFLTLNSTQCQSQVGALSDTTFITTVAASVSASSTPDICSSGQGTVTATGTGSAAPYTYNWPALGATTPSVSNVVGGTYIVKITDGNGCLAQTTVTVANTPANFTSSSTLVSCSGGNDGTATATMTPVLGTVTYQWDDPAGQTTQTATGLTAGTYHCTVTSSVGCNSVVTVTVTEIPGLQANFTTITDATCNSKNDGVLTITVNQGTAPYTYSWDNSTSTGNTANDLYAGNHTVTITDNTGCVITKTQAIGEPAPLQITSLTPNTQICPEDNITLNVTGTGGSTAHTFTWTSNGELLGTGNSILVDPTVTNTSYCVQLSEECGSPVADSCVLITFPTPIMPQLTPNKYEDCMPGEFLIQNTSLNIAELASTYIDFGNLSNTIVPNGEDFSITYNKPGTYTLEIRNTSVFGCVYDTTFVDYFTVHPDPIARFALGGNPGTIYETSMIGQDLSTDDVVAWKWESPFSTPAYSDLQFPKFKFPEGVEGKYPVMLVVTTQMGCVDTAVVDAIIEDVILFFVPNSFTPDGDEFNQSWKLIMKGGDQYGFNLKVFNRWGEIVWETDDASIGWDGTYKGQPAPQGEYTWRASIKHRNNDGKDEYTGHVNLLR
ncbi:MAG: gliding motility-associated C-terminal domain-containing protein [Crocinitomicaceae bacterium]|nr:gliding motility-associated C-terminal domain-containing protein [Crocinitomicaceae bacterium]